MIKCDKCGDEIETFVTFEMRTTGRYETSISEKLDRDLCCKCAEDVVKSMFSAECVKKEKPEKEVKEKAVKEKPDNAAEKNVEVPENKNSKTRLDYGKIKALYWAGWDYKRISEEMGITEKSVEMAVYRIRKGIVAV